MPFGFYNPKTGVAGHGTIPWKGMVIYMKVKKLALVLLIVMILAGCTSDIADAPELLEPVGVKVDTTRAYIGTIYKIETYEGAVLPKIEELYFVSDGLIGEVNAFVGSQVKKGDVLARLDVNSYKTQLETLKSTLDFDISNNELKEVQAQCDIEIAEVELKQLQAKNATDNQILNKQVQIETLKNELEANAKLFDLSLKGSYEKIAELEKIIANSVITSPCDGTVVYTTATEGKYAVAYTPVLWVANDDVNYISCAYMSTEDVNNAYEVYATVAGDRVEVKHEPYDRATYLSMVSAGGEMKSKFQIADSKDLDIKSGMYALVYVISDYTENTLILPTGAVKRDNNGIYFVYRMVDGVQIRQDIKRGLVTDALVQIVDGLKEGDEVYVGN